MEEDEIKIGITKKQKKELAKYPHLEHYVYNYMNEEDDNDGDMSDLGVWIRVMCDENGLDPTEVLKWKYDEDFDYEEYNENPDAHPEWDWTTALAADFLASGHNTAWQAVEEYLESEKMKVTVGLVLDIAKEYGDVDILEY